MTDLHHKTPADFDLLTCKLTGSTLLEASAGTGKTFSLSFLYLRLLLEQNLRVEHIVVVTFTNAATNELSRRIYERITEAEHALMLLDNEPQYNHVDTTTTSNTTDQTPEPDIDPLLKQLLQRYCQHETLAVLQKRLRLAKTQFDRAQIYSINGFALHLLQEHAATLNGFIPEDIIDDNRELIQTIYLQLADDNFSECGEQADAIGEVVAQYRLDDLLNLLTAMHTHRQALQRGETLFIKHDNVVEPLAQIIATVTATDYPHQSAIAQIANAIDHGYLNKTTYKSAKLDEFASQLTDPSAYHANNLRFIAFFSGEQLRHKTNKAAKDIVQFVHPLFDLFDKLLKQIDAYTLAMQHQQYHQLMCLVQVIADKLHQLKAEQMQLCHDDIVEQVATHCHLLNNLPYQAVLLDEAQDTNHAQLTLLTTLFLQRGYSCFFVGDPKQAIYGFRGGDVYTYCRLRQMVDRCYRLPMNYRSTAAVNAAVNALFLGNPFQSDNAPVAANTGIIYHPVTSKHDNENSEFDGQSLTRVQSTDKGPSHLADVAAKHLVHLLHQNLHICDENHVRRPLRSSDIAILVRSNRQADYIKNALAQRGLAAAYNGKTSVYESDEAILMYTLLQAIDSRKNHVIRALMLSPLFNYQVADVKNEQLVNTLRRDFQILARHYDERGFAVMFYQLMQQYHIAARLLDSTHGKRRLSNFIQLFECLQQGLQEQPLTLLALSDWLLRRIQHRDKSGGELRLEDPNAITIMTMHTAKGLEFNVVCLPFLDYQSSPKTSSTPQLMISQSQHVAALATLQNPTINALAKAESDAESVRLAYVALTRAVYHTIVIEQPITGSNKTRDNSLWQHLLSTHQNHVGNDINSADWITTCPEIDDETLYYHPSTTAMLQVKPTPKRTPTWLMTSFSALQQRFVNHQPPLNTVSTPIIPSFTTPLMTFIGGAKAGTLLHHLYEHYMLTRCCDAAFIDWIDKQLTRTFSRAELTNTDATTLATAIADTADIILAPQSFSLNDIDQQQQSIEMAFILHLSADARQHIYQHFGQPSEATIKGYLQGFIDYWFAYQGRYYLLDYKSNQLGEHLADYDRKTMQTAMNAHRYDLQALIYTVALCKHLDIDNEKDYQRLIGGYYYLFIRGMNPIAEFAHHGIYYDRIDWTLIAPLLQSQ